MIKFLIKGILGDKNRSVLPIIIISIGVFLTILLSGFLRGVMEDIVNQNARFDTGHVKVMSKAYAKEMAQIPNDLALLGVDTVLDDLKSKYPDVEWAERIKFGGLMDVASAEGESKGQGPAAGMAFDLFGENSHEMERMNIHSSLVRGAVPQKSNEALIGELFAQKLNLNIGDEITYMGTTMNGSMTFENFKVVGTVRFGVANLDRGAIIIDVSDARRVLDMEDGVGEILGYFPYETYDEERAKNMAHEFNKKYENSTDEYAPIMLALSEQNNLEDYIGYVDYFAGIFVGMFVFAMSIVLWNTGLLGGLRRYQEFGIRLALGEEKGHIYRTLIYEAVLIGIVGSIVGSVLGIAVVFYLQVNGLYVGDLIPEGNMMIPEVYRAKFTPDLLYLGFIPGVFAMVLGNMLSGIGIYKRSTASLFKELEV